MSKSVTNQIPESFSAIDVLAESQLKELQSIYETAPVGLAVLDRDLRFLRVNNRLAEMNGIPAKQHIGKTVREIVPQLAPVAERIFQQVMETGQPLLNLEIVGETAAQPGVQRVWVENYSPLLSEDGRCIGVNVVVEEITERKQIERRRDANFAITKILAESPSLNEATPRILQTIGETLGWEIGDLWILDSDANVLRCLKVWYDPSVNVDNFVSVSNELTFAPGVGLAGRVWTSFKPAWIPDVTKDNNFPRAASAVQAGLHAGFAFPIVFRHKLLGVMEFFSREIRQRDHALLAMFDSIGSQIGQFMERKRAEEALRDADRRKDEFLAILGHELRNPLGVISTAVQLLRIKAPPDPELHELRDTIELQVKQLDRLLDDLLDISRIARGVIRLKREPCDLTMIVRQAAEAHRTMFEQQGLDLLLELPGKPSWVMGDPTRLAQIIGNLLYNANKFTNPGGRVTVRLTEEPTRGTVLLTVRDTGIGMVPEILNRVFEPFTQADRAIDRSRGGLGLGLALVRALVDLHGGEVWASSDGLGRGSEFTVRFSVAEEPPLGTKPIEPIAGGAAGRRILVIEDNFTAARNLRMFLSESGHSVEVALSGPDGIETARRFRPEVVLCDIGLPGLDGYAVAQALRQEPELKGIYVIAVSGYGQDAHQRCAVEGGFDAYLTKPIDLNELERLLREAATAESTTQHA